MQARGVPAPLCLFSVAAAPLGVEIRKIFSTAENHYLRPVAPVRTLPGDCYRAHSVHECVCARFLSTQLFVDIVELILFIWPLVFFLRFQIQNVFRVLAKCIATRRSGAVARWRTRQNSLLNRRSSSLGFDPDAQMQSVVPPPAAISPEMKAMQSFTNEMDYIVKVSTHEASRAARRAGKK